MPQTKVEIKRRAIDLWNLRQGSALPRLHERIEVFSMADKLSRQSDGGTRTVHRANFRALYLGSRPARIRDPGTGESLIIVTLKLLEKKHD